MAYICKICNDTFIRQCGLSRHIQTKHNMSSKEYYDLYYKKSDEGKCLTCNKPTKFINIASGYCSFCSNYCVGKNKSIQERKKKTTRKHFNVDWPSQSKEVQKTKIDTLNKRYNCSNAFNITSIKEKAQKNSHTTESNKKRNKSQSKTKKVLWSQPEYKQDKLNKCINTNLQNFGKPWSSNSDIVKSKISTTVKSDDCQNRTKQTCLARYGVQHHTQSRHYIESAKKRYLYNNITFDSSWELALYIYAIDHNIPVIRTPCTFTYYDSNNVKHTYTPDFLYDSQLVEIKGDQFFNENGTLINVYSKKVDTDKLNCMKANNVKLLRYSDIKSYISYCSSKYLDKPWYKSFRKTK